MKVLVITLALAGLASTATLDAQILGRPLPSTNASINVDGSWRVVGRDGSGNTIYERRTQDRNGNILVQRAVRDSRGNMSVISSNTISNSGYGNSGTYNSNSIAVTIRARTVWRHHFRSQRQQRQLQRQRQSRRRRVVSGRPGSQQQLDLRASRPR